MAKEKDQEFLEFIIKNLVEKPEAVKINRTVDEMGVLLELTVDSEDMGRIIGKEGRTAKAIRSLLRVVGSKENARLNLKINEPEGAAPRVPKEVEEAPAEVEEVEESPSAEVVEDEEVTEIEESETSAVEEAKKEVEKLGKELEE